MGNLFAPTTSSTTATDLNSIAINAATSVIQQCIAANTNSQNISLNSVGNVNISGLSMNQSSTINMSCVMNNSTQTQIANQVANALVQAVASKTSLLSAFGTASQSTAVTNLQNAITSNINISVMQQQMATTFQAQNLSATSGGNITLTNTSLSQTANTVAKFIVGNSAYANVINNLQNKVNQTATASGSTTGITSITTMIIILVIIAVLGGLAYVYLDNKQ